MNLNSLYIACLLAGLLIAGCSSTPVHKSYESLSSSEKERLYRESAERAELIRLLPHDADMENIGRLQGLISSGVYLTWEGEFKDLPLVERKGEKQPRPLEHKYESHAPGRYEQVGTAGAVDIMK